MSFYHREQAFEVLRQIVAERFSTTRTPLPLHEIEHLFREQNRILDETPWIFKDFIDLVFNARESGFVTLGQEGADGPLFLCPPDERPNLPTPATPSSITKWNPISEFISNDLFYAFMKEESGEVFRVFDRKKQRGFVVFKDASPNEHGWVAEVRKEIIIEPSRFIMIPLIPVEERIRWGYKFVERIKDPGLRLKQENALGKERWGWFMTNLIKERDKGNTEIWEQWRKFQDECLFPHVMEWAVTHHLTPRAIINALTPAGLETLKQSIAQTSPLNFDPSPDDEGRLREMLKAIIDKMELQDLISLKIPLKYLINKIN